MDAIAMSKALKRRDERPPFAFVPPTGTGLDAVRVEQRAAC